jgi:lipoprotein-anchoring transpeptidase ErfK/SrfK
LHGDYWTPESNIGNFTSNGCVGMLDEDELYMWNFLYVGSAVSIPWSVSTAS